MTDALKLTTYLGERDHALADALIGLYARHGIRIGALFRGVEGFGHKHHLHTARLLTLSEDLPLVSVAVDAPERIAPLAEQVRMASRNGLVTVERARFGGPVTGEAKLTVYVGRRERRGEAVVAALHAAGLAGATVLLGVDGIAGGVRQRARFLGRNADVPQMVIAVGDGERIAAVLGDLDPLAITLERVTICKRDGERLAVPPDGPWVKLMVYASEQARHGGAPLYAALVRRLRASGASGATVLRGTWGFHGDHAPHGDRFWSLARHVPVVVTTIERRERVAGLFAIVDELTAQTGLVTAEVIPDVRL
ncbi:MAG: hypothetical protein QOE86_2589 [Solirubrobacteraceae bacterium]|nr:hypothetical protein [Solirubrobacteraceae bacterium]